ncbi:MAG: DUF1761 family protein [Flavobacteriaceae bacterium]|nr:DUF1761 family protein [Flavobacteriaceae bacterium]
MDLNYFAFLLISFIPLIIGWYWYHPNSFISKYSKVEFVKIKELNLAKVLILFMMSFTLVYGYINLIIHQMGFYELFFTDIMLGNSESEEIVNEFLNKYGDKHRHFGHGVFHGIINAFVFALPFIGAITIIEKRSKKYLMHHFSFWLITSAIIGGCISEFV